jgi:uncharacterized membrane protein
VPPAPVAAKHGKATEAGPAVAGLAMVLALAGLGISTYLTIAHYVGGQSLVCSDSGLINCQKVTTSAQSHLLGVPVAVLGLGFYLVMVAINLPAAWRTAERRVHLARMVLVAVGMAFALYLVSAELLIIGSICIWCTAVHVVTFLLFIVVVTAGPRVLGWASASAPKGA